MAQFTLMLRESGSSFAHLSPRGADARLLEWEIVVPTKKDADEAAQNVLKAGYEAKPENGEWILTDPWGTSLRLVPEKK